MDESTSEWYPHINLQISGVFGGPFSDIQRKVAGSDRILFYVFDELVRAPQPTVAVPGGIFRSMSGWTIADNFAKGVSSGRLAFIVL
jgi:hypothetical protein